MQLPTIKRKMNKNGQCNNILTAPKQQTFPDFSP